MLETHITNSYKNWNSLLERGKLATQQDSKFEHKTIVFLSHSVQSVNTKQSQQRLYD